MRRDNNAMPARMATSKTEPVKPRKMRGFNVRFADNGGAIVRHDMEGGDGPYMNDPEHVFSTPDEVHAHIKSIYPASAAPQAGRANVQEPGEQA